jgi:hypothetical protein
VTNECEIYIIKQFNLLEYISLSIIRKKVINQIKIIILLQIIIIKVYFGQAGASDFTIHRDEARKQRYINRHQNNEKWTKSGIDTAGFWSRWILWHKPTIKESYMAIKKRFYL